MEGIWRGQGHGEFPTIDPFDYRETLIFTRRDGLPLAYDQRTYKRNKGQIEFVTSHWENGFIRILENEELELVNAQSGGRAEILIGHIEKLNSVIRMSFVSKALLNDKQVVSTARTFELKGDTLHCEMKMATTKIDRLMQHLTSTLQKVAPYGIRKQ